MPSKLGFAAMDPQKQREIASKGGRTAHKIGRAHRFSHEEAVVAGKKGGEKRKANLMASAATAAATATGIASAITSTFS